MRRRIGLAALALLLLAGAVAYQRLRARASIGAGYVAKEVCSCVFVAGRDPGSCRSDVPESMDPVELEMRPDGVRAFITGVVSRVARYEPGFGCTLY